MVNKPEKKYKAGAVSATVWKNEGQKNGKSFAFHTISLSRAYKDKDNNWKNSSSLRPGDLPKAALVLSKAYEYLTMNSVEEGVIEEELVV
ncbi:hypothetical protein KY333_04680 [Candidatus Woesearchaeota archaeon]|nr:hypothetical protein [Candidatus Woesearchaeota archaeon]MBW2994187.1 hypothetical protein [Candidatus Woesearchaeota archaeon]